MILICLQNNNNYLACLHIISDFLFVYMFSLFCTHILYIYLTYYTLVYLFMFYLNACINVQTGYSCAHGGTVQPLQKNKKIKKSGPRLPCSALYSGLALYSGTLNNYTLETTKLDYADDPPL